MKLKAKKSPVPQLIIQLIEKTIKTSACSCWITMKFMDFRVINIGL
jgi:hypothetical protein